MDKQEVWKVVYSSYDADNQKVWNSPQSFKSEQCARRGVNVIEGGYVIGFQCNNEEMIRMENPIKTAYYYKETGLDKEFQ